LNRQLKSNPYVKHYFENHGPPSPRRTVEPKKSEEIKFMKNEDVRPTEIALIQRRPKPKLTQPKPLNTKLIQQRQSETDLIPP